MVLKKINFFCFFIGFISSLLFTEFQFKSQYFFLKQVVKNSLLKSKRTISQSPLGSCPINEVDVLPNKSTVIIGHAYGSVKGSQTRKNIGIAPKIENFLLENKFKIDTVIFSGDVFSVPSKKKWESLYSRYKGYFDIYIAPGNHDVGNI